jgi:DNA polymerase
MPTLAEIEADARTCVACPLALGRTKVVFSAGNPASDLMFVGEAPGHDEDLQGEPFVGRSGKLLDRLIAEELDLDPQPGEVEACRHYLESQVDLVAPKVIVTLGNFAVRALLETTETVTRLRGKSYPYASTVVVPTFHPSYALRGGGVIVAEMRADLVRAKRLLASPSS